MPKSVYFNRHTHKFSDKWEVAERWYRDGFRVVVVRLDDNGKPFHVWNMI